MKILHINAGNETGGGKTHIIGLLTKMNALKENLIAELLVFEEGPVAEAARKNGIPVHVIENRNFIKTVKQMVLFIQDNGYQVLHTHGPRANFFMRLAIRKLTIPWVTTIHSNPEIDFQGRGLKGFIFKQLHVWSYSQINSFLLITESFKNCLSMYHVPSEKMISLYNAIEFSDSSNCHLSTEATSAKSCFTLTIVARLEAVKNHQLLFRALAGLPFRNFQLLVIGDGPLLDELKALAKSLGLVDQIKFLGFQEDVNSFYQLTDVSLLTSTSEGFPTVLLESANWNVPAIATDVGAVKKIIPDSSYGWVVASNQQEQLQEALLEAYKEWQEQQLTIKGMHFSDYTRKNFTMDLLAADIGLIYHQLQSVNDSYPLLTKVQRQ